MRDPTSYPTLPETVAAAEKRLGSPYAGIRAQLQTDDPDAPGNALMRILRDWASWRMRRAPKGPSDPSRMDSEEMMDTMSPFGGGRLPPFALSLRRSADPVTNWLQRYGADEAVRAAQRGDSLAMQQILETKQPRLEALARRYVKGRGLGNASVDDLVQAARIGLTGAVRRYNPLKPNLSVDAYMDKAARYAIDREAMRYISAAPEGVQKLKRRISEAVQDWTGRHGKPPDKSFEWDYIARKLGIERDQLERARVNLAPSEFVSLSTPRHTRVGSKAELTPEALRVPPAGIYEETMADLPGLLQRAGGTSKQIEAFLDRFGAGPTGRPLTNKEIAQKQGIKSDGTIQKQIDGLMAKLKKTYGVELKIPPRSPARRGRHPY